MASWPSHTSRWGQAGMGYTSCLPPLAQNRKVPALVSLPQPVSPVAGEVPRPLTRAVAARGRPVTLWFILQCCCTVRWHRAVTRVLQDGGHTTFVQSHTIFRAMIQSHWNSERTAANIYTQCLFYARCYSLDLCMY